ncbi:33411_t:CDS:2, partial [Gigaspora margarita]
IKEEGPTILELISSKLNFKAVKALERLNLFYTNQLILQNELIIIQDAATRKIKDDLGINANLKELAIPNLQKLSNPSQESCTLRLSKERIMSMLPKGALEPLNKITKIKSNLWQGVQNKQQSNPKSTLLGLKDLESLEIELIQRQHFDNKLSLKLIEKLRCITHRNKKTICFYTDSSLFKTTSDKPEELIDKRISGELNKKIVRISRIIELMSIKDLELELNKIKEHSENRWNNIVDSIAKKGALDNNVSIADFQEVPSLRVLILWKDYLIDSPIQKMLQTIKEFTIEIE